MCYGNVKHVRSRIFYGDIVLCNALKLQLSDTLKASDTVERMNHKVAGSNIRKGLYFLALFLFSQPALGGHCLCLSDKGSFYVGVIIARGQTACCDKRPALYKLRIFRHYIAGDTVVSQVLGNNGKSFFRPCKDYHRIIAVDKRPQILRKLSYFSAPRRSLVCGKGPQLFAAHIVCAQEGIRQQTGTLFRLRRHLCKLCKISLKPSAKLALLKEYLHVLVKLGKHSLCLFAAGMIFAEKHNAFLWKIVKNKRGLFICKREIFIHICKGNAVHNAVAVLCKI